MSNDFLTDRACTQMMPAFNPKGLMIFNDTEVFNALLSVMDLHTKSHCNYNVIDDIRIASGKRNNQIL